MKKESLKTLISIAVIVVGFAAIFGLGNYLEKSHPELPAGYEDQDLALQGAKLKGYALGFEGLIADWYWMKSLQYVGDKILKNPDLKISVDDLNALNPRLLYPYLDNATTLDPKFVAAYSYGAIVLPAINKEQAINFVRKGIENNPNESVLYNYLGYIYWKSKDYEKAAEVYEKGAELKDAPPFMKLMAANMKSDGGSRSTARAVYREMYNAADDPQVKAAINQRLMTNDALDETDAITAVLKTFQQKNGRCTSNWNELLPLLKNVKLPDGLEFRLDQSNRVVDPTNAPYMLDQTTCEAKIDFTKTDIIPIK